ncbi:hypothetical protein MMC17_003153 [Xylographa soralifera]|nr:hypothetical protein [Xylographa soralifera]
MAFPTYLITPSQLQAAITSTPPEGTRIIPLCAPWFLPNDAQQRTGPQVYKEAHIPGALLLTSISSKELGIFSAPRVGWTFKVFGHDKVHVLNKFKTWVEHGYPIESGAPDKSNSVTESEYPVPVFNAVRVVGFDKMKTIASQSCQAAQVLDARPHGRWLGKDPEPRPGLPSGHMPGSFSIPFVEVLDPSSKAMLSPEELKKYFEGKGVDGSKPVIASCETGVTAAVVDLALEQAFGKGSGETRGLYDGSWT